MPTASAPAGVMPLKSDAFRNVLRCAAYTSQRRLTLEGITFEDLTPSLKTVSEHLPNRLT